ncbi:Crp/Fnr family transcriptional regulator [Algoriphagus pacificus]|uniref:Crp/Fnr family transcriptional regulator n=1 Tax=Algoriphagus pacificus TaxID=2811234 RepID=A0ABS3CGN1_9BACT|nr:Crp/Fnr family transcriptional regulator [Algoriphagus pacificus]MBN7816262.1 Crp/Fnr family transcriptional regulator [Algoriphagus pacificus]
MNQLIADYNSIRRFSAESYETVFQKLILRKVSRGEILKKVDMVDIKSRYICEGYLGLFREGKSGFQLFRIFGKSDTAFDEQSFRSNTPSNSIIRALSDTVYLGFTLESEIELLSNKPEFYALALEVTHRINKRHLEQEAIKAKKFKDGFPLLLKKFPGIGQYLKNQDLADFFNCSISTVERLKYSIMNDHEIEHD